MLTKDQIVVGVVVIVLGFVGMGLFRVVEMAWNDHGQIGENTTEIEANRTNVQAVIDYLNRQGAAFVPPAPAEDSAEPPAQ